MRFLLQRRALKQAMHLQSIAQTGLQRCPGRYGIYSASNMRMLCLAAAVLEFDVQSNYRT